MLNHPSLMKSSQKFNLCSLERRKGEDSVVCLLFTLGRVGGKHIQHFLRMAETIEEEQILYAVRRAIDLAMNKYLCVLKASHSMH